MSHHNYMCLSDSSFIVCVCLWVCVLVHAKVQRKSDEVCKIQKIKNNLSGVVQSRQSFEHEYLRKGN